MSVFSLSFYRFLSFVPFSYQSRVHCSRAYKMRYILRDLFARILLHHLSRCIFPCLFFAGIPSVLSTRLSAASFVTRVRFGSTMTIERDAEMLCNSRC